MTRSLLRVVAFFVGVVIGATGLHACSILLGS